MRAIVQRVREASVTVEERITGQIGPGMLIFVGIEEADTSEDIQWLAAKIARMRIFDDEAGVMNRSVIESGGDVLVVSQFTLHASIKKGNRPYYGRSASPDISIPLYEEFLRTMEMERGKPVAAGVFGAEMKVSLLNDGPVTIMLDSKRIE